MEADHPSTRTPSALAGVRVLDLTRVLAGPYCAQNLADLGAEVIKVERPASATHDGGDDTRTWGPPYVKDEAGNDTSVSTYYVAANRGKQSIAIDLASADGQRLVRELAMTSDVVIENYKVGQLAKYGLDYASLAKDKPGLIYCSITGFGQTGPWARRPGYDFIVQGLSGFMSITGEREDACPHCHGGPPQKAGIAISDLLTGIYASTAILAALLHVRKTGQGQHIDMALLDVMIATMANMNTAYLNSGTVPGRAGNAHVSIVPYQVFACADGHLILAVGNDLQFRRFCEAAGCAGLADDARFATNPARVKNRDVLVPLLEAILMGRGKHTWIAQLEAADVPCGPIDNIAEVFENPQVQARGMKIALPHALAGHVSLVANPMRMSATPPRYDLPPPMLDEHRDAILAMLQEPQH
ncbi:MAG: CaiB/BaiF CoA transferase family protein [Burkholderiaceae bacterium]